MLVASCYGLKLQWGNITLQPYTANSEIHPLQGTVAVLSGQTKWLGDQNLPPKKNMLVSYLITCAPHVWNISPTFAIPNLYDTYIIYKYSSPHIGDMYFWIMFLLPLPKLGVTSNGRTPCGAGFFGMLGDGGEASAKLGLRRWGAMGIGGFFGFRKRCVIIIGYSDLKNLFENNRSMRIHVYLNIYIFWKLLFYTCYMCGVYGILFNVDKWKAIQSSK